MSFKQYMQPRQRSQFQAVGEFIYVESCSDTVLIQTERGEYRLKPGAQVLDSQLSGRITVENLGEAGTVEIICGFGQYIPPQDGQTVTVSQMPAMTIAANQQVAVSQMPAATVKTLPPVVVETLPAVIVSQLPKVQLETGQAVAVSQMPAVTVKTLPPVVVETLPAVAVSQLPKVQLETGQAIRVYGTHPLLTKPVGGASVETSVLTITSGQAELLENTSRCHIVLKAAASNTGAVTIGNGFELSPGEKQKIDSFGALVFTGTESDKIQVLEVLR